MKENLKRMEAAVTEWLTKEGLLGDAQFYSIEEWAGRSEEFLQDSLLVLVFDGSTLHTMLNFGGDTEEFDDLISSFGFFYELGHSWNMGFYEIEGYDFRPSTGAYSNKLRDQRWVEKSERVKKLANYRCQDCGADSRLDAHHCYYAAMRHGYEPWEYPLSAFRALCHSCHLSRAQIEVRMRSYMAGLTQTEMERLREGLEHAFYFYGKDALFSFLELLGPQDRHVDAAVISLRAGAQNHSL